MPESSYVFESGKAIAVGRAGDHSLLFHSGDEVPDAGSSSYIFERGTALGGRVPWFDGWEDYSTGSLTADEYTVREDKDADVVTSPVKNGSQALRCNEDAATDGTTVQIDLLETVNVDTSIWLKIADSDGDDDGRVRLLYDTGSGLQTVASIKYNHRGGSLGEWQGDGNNVGISENQPTPYRLCEFTNLDPDNDEITLSVDGNSVTSTMNGHPGFTHVRFGNSDGRCWVDDLDVG